MKTFTVEIKHYKWGKKYGYLVFITKEMIKANNIRIVKKKALELSNSTKFALDLYSYPDLRTIKLIV